MAHSHAHSEAETENTYFLDQLCTIAVGGLLGFTAIGLYMKGWLTSKFNLVDRFHIPVLAGGIVIIVLVLLRAIAVWKQAGQARAAKAVDHQAHGNECGHDHGPGEKCDHDHEHSHGHEHSYSHGHEHAHSHGHEHSHSHGHEHSHSHGHEHGHSHGHEHSHSHGHDHAHAHGGGHDDHDHGWAPWQYAVLIIPAVLYFLELPVDGHNLTKLNRDLQEVDLDPGVANQRLAFAHVAGSAVLPTFKKKGIRHLKFSDLSVIASRKASRDDFEGATVVMKGQFRRSERKDNEFQLFRVMVNCCGTDAITLRALIVAPEPLQGYQMMEWVEITGEMSFQQIRGTNQYLPVITLPTMEGIQRIAPPSDPNRDV